MFKEEEEVKETIRDRLRKREEHAGREQRLRSLTFILIYILPLSLSAILKYFLPATHLKNPTTYWLLFFACTI